SGARSPSVRGAPPRGLGREGEANAKPGAPTWSYDSRTSRMNERIDVESAYWATLLTHRPLGIMTDLDGTLLPFAERPEDAKPSPALRALIREVATLQGVTLAIVSGRPRDVLEAFFPAPREALLVAEHGAWRTGPSGWEPTLAIDKGAVDSLVS